MSKQFRKKPVVIEAVQLIETDQSILQATKFIEGVEDIHNTSTIGVYRWDEYKEFVKQDGGIQIKTLEGVMLAKFGDWIIKGVSGEFYPCKPDIFEKTYEPVITTP